MRERVAGVLSIVVLLAALPAPSAFGQGPVNADPPSKPVTTATAIPVGSGVERSGERNQDFFGSGSGEAGAPIGTVSYGSSDLQSLVPERLLDTREGNGAPVGKVGPGSTTVLQVAGRGGVPAFGAGAVVLNVTATDPTANGYITVFPTGVPAPLASNLNINVGQTVPNLVVVKLGVAGQVSLFNQAGETNLVADVAGWFPEGSGLQPMSPTRVLDTRGGNGAPIGPVTAGGEVRLQIAGRGGVPAAGAASVVLNVTVTEPTSAGFVTVYPSGSDRPLASNLNFTPGQTIPNLVVAKLGPDGAVTLFNSAGNTHLVADVAGWFMETSALAAISPLRVLDTRDGNGAPTGAVGPQSVTRVQLEGRPGLPSSGMGAVILNVTVTQPTANGFITVYPSGVDRPTASNLNMQPGQTVPNLVIAKVGAGGAVDLFNSAGSSHLVADVVGWFNASSGSPTEITPREGTVLGGSGDVLSVVAGPDSSSSVILSGSADVPPVGGYLAIAPDAAIEGAFGKVESVTPNADGTVTVVLTKAALEDAFAGLKAGYDGPIDLSTPSDASLPTAHTEAGADCKATGSLGYVTPDIELVGFTAIASLDLAARHVLVSLHGAVKVSFDVNLTASFSCTIKLPKLRIPLPPTPMVLAGKFGIQFSVSGQIAATFSATADAQFGFEATGTDVNDLNHVDLSAGVAGADSPISVSVTMDPSPPST